MGYDQRMVLMLAKPISLLVIVREGIENQDIERRTRDAG